MADKKNLDGQPLIPGAENIFLPSPVAPDVTLGQALKDRRSVRVYAERLPGVQNLSNLLWAADGINREDGKRTAPSAMNRQSVSIYVAFEKGAYRYDYKAHSLNRVTETDVRKLKSSPLELIFTSNLAPRDDSPKARDMVWLLRGIDAGTVSQNAALYCAAVGLSSVIRMYHEPEPERAAALQLSEDENMLFFMPVGYEK